MTIFLSIFLNSTSRFGYFLVCVSFFSGLSQTVKCLRKLPFCIDTCHTRTIWCHWILCRLFDRAEPAGVITIVKHPLAVVVVLLYIHNVISLTLFHLYTVHNKGIDKGVFQILFYLTCVSIYNIQYLYNSS